jgi:hypothetical protein
MAMMRKRVLHGREHRLGSDNDPIFVGRGGGLALQFFDSNNTQPFLADTTGSMQSALDNVKANVVSIMNQMRAAQPATQFGVASYKDFNCVDHVLRSGRGGTK